MPHIEVTDPPENRR